MVDLQRTDAWWLARRGKITSSKIARVVNGGKKGWNTLARELAAEMQMDTMPDTVRTAAMQRGEDMEPSTLANAALDYGFKPVPVGFVQHPGIPYLGASSDFIVRIPRSRKVINGEGKAPANIEIHMTTVMTRQLPEKYKPQVMLQMEVHRADLTYYISHHPEALDWKWKTVKIDVLRDQNYIDYMLERCEAFMRFYTFTDTPRPRYMETF